MAPRPDLFDSMLALIPSTKPELLWDFAGCAVNDTVQLRQYVQARFGLLLLRDARVPGNHDALLIAHYGNESIVAAVKANDNREGDRRAKAIFDKMNPLQKRKYLDSIIELSSLPD